MLYMKNLILLILLVLPFCVFSQPGNNNNTNQQNNNGNNATPFSNNPFDKNPYDKNPFLDQNQQNNPNFFDKKNELNNKQNNPNTNAQNPENANKQDVEKALQDLNINANKTQEEQLLELYKNDPDYLRYLMATKNNENAIKDSTPIEVKVKQKVYGDDFFSSNSFDLSDKNPVAPPLDYRLGPGDEILVSLWNAGELQQSYIIAKDGSIFPRSVGKIYIQGLTLQQAQNTIASHFRKIAPSNTNIDVQLGKARSIRVTILGEVRRPGTYTISAFNDALNAIFRSGGITEIGNLRSIEIIRDGRTIDEIDIYKYLQNNTNTTSTYLEDNDFIKVGVYEKKVLANGEFKRPMYYQLKNDEGLYELIEFSGGTRFNARNSQIQIKTVRNEEEQYININAEQFLDPQQNQNLLLRDGDEVTIKPINQGLRNVVKIEGAVNYPDEYEIKPGDKLSQVLQRAGGIISTAYTPRAFIYRGGNNLNSDAIKVDLNNLKENDDIQILSGDRILILSQKNFEEQFQIEVIGNVRTPKKITYSNNLTLKDVLLLCGGLRLDAENGRIEISNIVDSLTNYNIDSKGVNIRIVSINSNLELDPISDKIILKPYDRIYVRKKSEFLPEQKITILGEVKYPGEYVLVDNNEKISSIIKRAGGLNKFAFSDGAKLNRSIIGPVVIDLHSALKNIGSKQDLILRDGDQIIIPMQNEIVSVRGEVQQAINIKYDFDNSSIGYYINSAGGFGEKPWKKRINVKYQNGKMKTTKNFLFFHFYPKVKPGSLVTVPKKPEKTEKVKISEIFTYAFSSISTLATLVILSNSLKKQ